MTRKRYIYFIVFVSGAVVMSFEILGSRVLAPDFGNTIFVWGSLISVFLLGLSVGYFAGGRIADRNPSYKKFALLLLIPSFMLMLFPLYGASACDRIFELDIGYRMGPLTASLALFLLPSVFLGMVSPYTVRLQIRCMQTAGSTAGNLYAISTVGSIIGTIGTSFYLISVAGVKTIVFFEGVVLLLAALPLMFIKEKICVEED